MRPFDGPLLALIARRKRVQILGNSLVFHRDGGQPVMDLRKSWATACKAAGVPGMLGHDLRRTFVRDAVRSGVPEAVVMKLTGHKTRSTMERYNIVSDADLRQATVRDASHIANT